MTESVSDEGDTVKWLWELDDGARVETVLMHYPDRSTVCVSTQAGCAMACSFCATGQAGFERHLTVGEIVEQVAVARQRAARDRHLGGCPTSCSWAWASRSPTTTARGPRSRRIHGDIGVGARHLTVSTVGVVPGIRRLATEDLPVNLAVSLHAANDELRDELVPINRRYPLERAGRRLCATTCEATHRRLSLRVGADRRGQRPPSATPSASPRSPAGSGPTSTSSR